jgi:hypothetical protein
MHAMCNEYIQRERGSHRMCAMCCWIVCTICRGCHMPSLSCRQLCECHFPELHGLHMRAWLGFQHDRRDVCKRLHAMCRGLLCEHQHDGVCCVCAWIVCSNECLLHVHLVRDRFIQQCKRTDRMLILCSRLRGTVAGKRDVHLRGWILLQQHVYPVSCRIVLPGRCVCSCGVHDGLVLSRGCSSYGNPVSTWFFLELPRSAGMHSLLSWNLRRGNGCQFVHGVHCMCDRYVRLCKCVYHVLAVRLGHICQLFRAGHM